MLTGGSTQYSQGALAVRPGVGRKPIPRKAQDIQQKQVELAMTVSPWDWCDLKIAYTSFSYNRDVATYLANLDNPQALKSGAATFGSTLTGFSSKESEVELTFHLPYDIDLVPNFIQSTNAANASKTNTAELNVFKTWADTWKTGLGYEDSQSTTNEQNLFIVTLAYEF